MTTDVSIPTAALGAETVARWGEGLKVIAGWLAANPDLPTRTIRVVMPYTNPGNAVYVSVMCGDDAEYRTWCKALEAGILHFTDIEYTSIGDLDRSRTDRCARRFTPMACLEAWIHRTNADLQR